MPKLSRIQYIVIALGFLLLIFFYLKLGSRKAMDKVFRGMTLSGEAIVDSTAKALGTELKTAIVNGGVINALEYCNLNALPITEKMSREFDVKISRKATKYRNPVNAVDDLDLVAISDILANQLKGEPTPGKIYNIEGKHIFYKPIIMQEFCKGCHGSEEAMGPEVFEKISLLYPEDKAINFETGDLRGVWKVEFK